MTDASLYPEPPAALSKLTARNLMRYFGPGAILASVTIGSGELVWASRSGAIFGYSLLWCFFYVGVFKAIQVYSASRYFTLTGEHPAVTWRQLPGPPLWLPLLITLPAIVLMLIAFSAIPETLAGFLHRLFGLPAEGESVGVWTHLELWENVWSTVVLVLCLGLALTSSYRMVERVSLVVVALLVGTIAVSVVVLGPDLVDLIVGLFVPTSPVYPDWLLEKAQYAAEFRDRNPWLEVSVYLGAVGGGAYDYLGYVGMLREKRWGLAGRGAVDVERLAGVVGGDGEAARRERQRARLWLRAPLLDTAVSFVFVILTTLLFAVLGTLVLHTSEIVPSQIDLLTQQERFLTSFHPQLRWLYRAAVFLAFIGTLYGAFAVYRQTFLESLRSILPRVAERVPTERVGRWIVSYCFLGGLTVVWLPSSVAGDLLGRLTFGSVLSGALACGLWCFAMLWVDRARTPAPLRMGMGLRIAVWVSGLGMLFLGVRTLYAFLFG